jgi:putative flippase GtrA
MVSNELAKKRPIVFLSVGALNTLFDFGFYTFLTSSVFKNGENIALAGLISGTFALICAFLTHGFITWRGSHIDHKTLLRFFLFTGFGMWVIRPFLLSLFIKLDGLYNWADKLLDKIGIHFSYNFVANTGAFGLMLLIVLAYNFFVYEKYVFRFKDKDSNHTEPENHSES